MADITNFPSRKKSKGFLSSMTASAQVSAPVPVPDEPEPEPATTEPHIEAADPADLKPASVEESSNPATASAKKPPAHNTTVNLTLEQRAWLRWREVITKQSMGELIRGAIDEQMRHTPMPPELAAIFGSSS